MNLTNKKDIVFLILAGFFITNAIIAEMIGGKLIMFFGIFTQSIGIVLWPVVFITTDLVNEYYGKEGVKKLSFITVALIAFMFVILFICINIPAVAFSPVSDEIFRKTFGQSLYIIVGSIIAFITSQLLDSFIFWSLRNKTGKKMIWLRATGSTIISQLLDTLVVQFIAFVVPGIWKFNEFIKNAAMGYAFKLIIAVVLIPLIYLAHYLIDKYLGEKTSDELIRKTAEKSLEHPVTE
jgi:hypothetical protein